MSNDFCMDIDRDCTHIVSMRNQIADLTRKLELAREALEKIGAPKRSDGTYNHCREACEHLANEALSAIKEK